MAYIRKTIRGEFTKQLYHF